MVNYNVLCECGTVCEVLSIRVLCLREMCCSSVGMFYTVVKGVVLL